MTQRGTVEGVFRLTLILVGIINAYPMIASFAPAKLTSLYGITVIDPNMLVLLRHRAVLFGLLGIFLIVSAFHSALYTLATVQAIISMMSYVFIAWQEGNYII